MAFGSGVIPSGYATTIAVKVGADVGRSPSPRLNTWLLSWCAVVPAAVGTDQSVLTEVDRSSRCDAVTRPFLQRCPHQCEFALGALAPWLHDLRKTGA